MKVYVVRHGVAEDHGPSGRDADRQLTRDGRDELAEVAHGLAALDVRLEGILTSPLVRARETAEILARELPGPEPVETDALAPDGALEAVFRDLRALGVERVAIVGHEPSLGELVALATTGAASNAIPLRKAGVACLRFPGAPRARGATLSWLLTPKQLRKLARR